MSRLVNLGRPPRRGFGGVENVFRSPMGEVEAMGTKRFSKFVLERVEKWAKTRPDKIAIQCNETKRALTYGEFGKRVGMAAMKLREQGFQEGDTLLLHLPNCPEFAVGFHGCLEAGGKVSTSNPLYTSRELAHQIQDASVKHVITVPALEETAQSAIKGDVKLSVLGSSDCPLSQEGDVYSHHPEDFDGLKEVCAIPYSSGTTGLPKGVMLSHSNLATNVLQCEALGTQRPDIFASAQNDTPSPETFLGVLPFFHIYGMNTVLNFALTQGATVISMPRFDPATFVQSLKDSNITVAHLVPPLVLFLAHALKSQAQSGQSLNDKPFPNLKTVCSGAAPLDGATQSSLSAVLKTPIIQGYGMTESSPVTHMDLDSVPGTVGSLAPGTKARLAQVQDGQIVDVPHGAEGEILIQGPQVMLGYLNNPLETAKTLLPGGWLRTGDVGVILDDLKTFKIVDRVKELIKVKGLQVSPAELEGVLLQHPDILDVAVVARPCDRSGELPHAFVVSSAEKKDLLCKVSLSEYLNDQVAKYKHLHPDHITTVDSIPKSASGKILRRQLKADLLATLPTTTE